MSHGDFSRCLIKLRKRQYDAAWRDWMQGYRDATIAKRSVRLDVDFIPPK